MRIAFVGKGGSGKSAVAGTVARTLAAAGGRVLAIDSDPMPGLSWSIGMPASDAGIADEAVTEGPEGGPRYVLAEGLDAQTAVERYAQHGPDGIRLLQFGKLRGHVGALRRSQFAFNAIKQGMVDSGWHLVGDLPAGTRQAFFGWASFADVLVAVVEPSVKSIISARRLALMADPTGRREGAHLPEVLAVANKCRGADDVQMIADRTGLEVVATVPYDPDFAAAERAGIAPFDAAREGAAVAAIRSLEERLAHRDAAEA